MAASDSTSHSGLNPSSFLRPRRGRGKTRVQRSTQLPTPPRQEISLPRVEETKSYVKGGEEETSLSNRPAMISSPAPSVSDTVSNPIEKNFTDGATSDVEIVTPESYLKFIRNPYPSVIGENPVPNYTNEGNGSIKLSGRYKENSLTFKETENPLNVFSEALENITDGSYNFIIQFTDTTRYISRVFLTELDIEFKANNPYRTLNSVATVLVDDVLLSTYESLGKFKLGENYSEMDITNNINTKKEIISHIDWLVGSGAELRDVASMGSFTHKQTESLGFEFQDELDGEELDPNAKGSESNIGVDIGDSTDPVVESDPIVVNDVFPPFGVAGIRPNELRTKDGKKYRWEEGRRSIFGRRGRDRGAWICIGDTTPTQSTKVNTKPPPFNPPNPRGYGGLGNIPRPIITIGGGSFGGGGRGTGSGNNEYRNRFL